MAFNWFLFGSALIDFNLVRLSLLKSPAFVNDYWTVINTTVTEGNKHFPVLFEWLLIAVACIHAWLFRDRYKILQNAN